jgi:hypothetical protein
VIEILAESTTAGTVGAFAILNHLKLLIYKALRVFKGFGTTETAKHSGAN